MVTKEVKNVVGFYKVGNFANDVMIILDILFFPSFFQS